MRTLVALTTVLVATAAIQPTIGAPIGRDAFVNPTVIDFGSYSGFVGGPNHPDPWLPQGVRVWGSVGGGDIHTYPYTNNAVIVEFTAPVQRVGADVLHALSTVNRLEVYDGQGRALESVDGKAECFMALDVGSPVIYEARFIDLPDAWSTFPVIDNLHYEVPEPAALALLAGGGLITLLRRRRSA